MTKAQVEQLLGKVIVEVFEFKAVPDDTFAAYTQACAKLKELGVSHGSMQREAPIGLAFGDVGISKWRDLGPDVRELDGILIPMNGSFRDGDAVIYLAAKPEETV
jgi:hypothetical protein